MANIVSSVYEAFVQKDGRKTVHEAHTDIVGLVRDIVYTARGEDDLTAAMNLHAVSLGDELGAVEIQNNVTAVVSFGAFASPTLTYSTVADNIAALRTAYRDATRVDAIMIGDYLNTLTNGQLAAAFGITTQQAATLRANKLVPASSLALSVKAAVGQ